MVRQNGNFKELSSSLGQCLYNIQNIENKIQIMSVVNRTLKLFLDSLQKKYKINKTVIECGSI